MNGFVYIWFDQKRKMYYVGSHLGSEDDGYICSSRRMRKAYRRRPKDFKRRILKRFENIKYVELLKEEELWLKLAEKRKDRYYNMMFQTQHWASDNDRKKSIGQKISEAHKSNPNWGSWGKGKVLSNETKKKLREANKKQFEDESQRELRRQKSKELWSQPEYRARQIEKRKLPRKPLTEETKRKIGEKNRINMLKKWKDETYRNMQIESHKN